MNISRVSVPTSRSTKEHWVAFDKLRNQWALRREASGGATALSGFDFQLVSSLLRMARGSAQPERQKIYLEALSDLATLSSDGIVITQSKRTLSSSAIQGALRELWDIFSLAEGVTPELAPRLSYQLLASRQTIVDAKASLERWTPDTDFEPEGLKRFLSKVTITLEPEPRFTLAIFLVNAFAEPDPFDVIDRWVGRLLAAAQSSNFDIVTREVAIELEGMHLRAREVGHLFHVWSADDRPPDQVIREADVTRATLVGQIPTRRHLAEGRFARRWFYDELTAQAVRWLGVARRSDASRLPVFWLEGRSGTGKSVALLHLLADLFLEVETSVFIWLGQRADRLAEAVRWARSFFRQGYQVAFAADDPYTPDRHEQVGTALEDAVREFESVVVAVPHAFVPCLIFCGPTEQGDHFEDELSAKAELTRFLVPRETASDIVELRKWYEERTGIDASLSTDDSDILVVQVFFEWRTGQAIGDFAKRLKDRLGAMGEGCRSPSALFDLVATILAVNRIYGSYPQSAIDALLDEDPKLGIAFDRLLTTEEHFVYDSRVGGCRLAHPHLADAIYRTWFGRQSDWRHRKLHLSSAIDAAHVYGTSPSERAAPLWAVGRIARASSASTTDARERLDLIADELSILLNETYVRQRNGTAIDLADLPVWTDLSRHLGLALDPDPYQALDEAVRSSSLYTRGYQLACHKLIEHHQTYPAGRATVAAVLNERPDWVDYGWVAMSYVRAFGMEDIASSLRIYVTANADRPIAESLVVLLSHAGASENFRQLALCWIRVSTKRSAKWQYLTQQLLDAYPKDVELRDLSERFLWEWTNEPGWSHIWERLRRTGEGDDKQIRDLAFHWLGKADTKLSGWDRVWEALWKEREPSHEERLFDLGLRWLSTVSPNHGSWGYIFFDLREITNRLTETEEIAIDWIVRGTFEHGTWSHVWKALWTRGTNLDFLRRMGLLWLEQTTYAGAGWGYVWRDLWDHGADTERLALLGSRWLSRLSTDGSSFSMVWSVLWKHQPADAHLERLALAWLEKGPKSETSYVWELLLADRTTSSDDFARVAIAQLEGMAPDDPAWRRMWEPLLSGPEWCKDRAAALGKAWLINSSPTSEARPFVIAALFGASDRADETLINAAKAWLDYGTEHLGPWGYVWRATWNATGRKESDLRERGEQWLDRNWESGSWAYVWRSVWISYARNSRPQRTLTCKALRWMRHTQGNRGSWPVVWTAIWDRSDTPHRLLVRLARQLLRDRPPMRPEPVFTRIDKVGD